MTDRITLSLAGISGSNFDTGGGGGLKQLCPFGVVAIAALNVCLHVWDGRQVRIEHRGIVGCDYELVPLRANPCVQFQEIQEISTLVRKNAF